MDDEENILGNNTIEDVSWFCSLSESELDFLISLKALLQRAKVIGHEDLAQKFDLKMLRGLGLVLMEYLKGKVSSLSEITGLNDASLRLNASDLLKSKSGDVMSIDEIKACILNNRTVKR